jgi:hypothetical protein
VALGKGYKPPSGEVWTADMLRPGYKPAKAESVDWKKDRDNLMGSATKIKAQAQSFTPEGRAAKRQAVQNLKTAAMRRKRAEEMKAGGCGPARIRHYLLTGEE